MKTKIIMMSALLALLATGCNKEDNNGSFDGNIKIFSENMTAASNAKLQINPAAPVNGEQWLAGETIKVNSTVCDISGNNTDGYSVTANDVELVNNAFYAIYPGSSWSGSNNVVTIDNSTVTAPTITLTKLSLDFNNDGTHKVAFPMGAKADGNTTSMLFKHLTAGFQLTLENTTSDAVTVKTLKVIVYGDGNANPVELDDVTYTVKWANQGPAVPTGQTGTLTDRNVAYASEMNFDLRNGTTLGMTIAAGGDLQLCIPVTLATVKRITVIGYNGSDVVFSKTSPLSTPPTLVRNKIYPVKAIEIN